MCHCGQLGEVVVRHACHHGWGGGSDVKRSCATGGVMDGMVV